MSKAAVTRLFVGSVLAVVAGVVLAFVAVWVAYANDVFIMEGADVVGVRSTPFAWTMLAVAIVAALAVMAGLIGGLVAWIGALLNTAQIDDKSWFLVLLLLGLFSFGIVAMIAYVVAGPDGTAPRAAVATHEPRPV